MNYVFNILKKILKCIHAGRFFTNNTHNAAPLGVLYVIFISFRAYIHYFPNTDLDVIKVISNKGFVNETSVSFSFQLL